jgi:general secretion pathway protein G
MKIPSTLQRRRAALGARAGFSLAELMVVIVIIGLLATLVVPAVIRNLFVANEGKAVSDITTIESAITQYIIENNGRSPDNLEALVTPDDMGMTYLDQTTVPTDPWGNEYGYEPPQSGQPKPRIFTLGADGAVGGENENRDIDNFMIKNGEI